MLLRQVPYGVVVALCVVCGAGLVRADPAREARYGPSSLPGGQHIADPTPNQAVQVAVSGSAGYGVIPGLADEGGVHHRGAATLAVSVRPLAPWVIALGLEGTWDRHPDDEQGKDNSGNSLPYLATVVGLELSHGLSLGASARLELFGGGAAALPSGAAANLRALLSLQRARYQLIGSAGYRIDASSGSVNSGERFRRGDEVSLGVSDPDRVLLGVLGRYFFNDTWTVVVEGTAEPYVGSAAPGRGRSPLRLGLGATLRLSPRYELQAWSDLALQKRSPIAADRPRVTVEPRFSLAVTLQIVFGRSSPDGRTTEEEPQEEEGIPQPAKPKPVVLTGRALGVGGLPVEQAQIRAFAPGTEPEGEFEDPQATPVLAQAESAPEGHFALTLENPQPVTLHVQAPGQDPWTFAWKPGESLTLQDAVLQPDIPMGTLRVQVWDFSGTPLQATLRVRATKDTLLTDEEGGAEILLPAGQHVIEVRCTGFRKQVKKLLVESQGVTVFNVELRRAP